MNLIVFSLFVLVVFLVPDLLWWRWADRQVRPSRWARVVVAAFVVAMMIFPVTLVFLRKVALRSHETLPMWYVAATFLWHFLVMPAVLIAVVGRVVVRRLRPQADVASRRRFLTGAVALAPPVLTGLGVGISIPRLKDVRLREIDVPVPGLPKALDGMVIAHISDPHFGKFTVERSTDRAIELTNSIEADLVLGTGDWIDLSLVDLPQAKDFFSRIDPRGGMYVCEGNHDLIEDPTGFRRQAPEAGVPLLLDETATVEVRGEKVNLVGLRWGGRVGRPAPGAFNILLAHHPHAFDQADGYPLVLSGHTHGGQLMLNEQLGAGPVLFRYWSGLYRKPDRSLVVSNGIGHWFPLRTAAPAEVLKLTLRV
jgi:predicted MPP superfamily phosphohydrolase